MKNNYPPNFTDLLIKSFLKKLYTPKVMVQNVPKRNVFKLPFLGGTSFRIQKKLQKLFSDKLTSCNLKIVSMWYLRVKVYKYECGGCNTSYYGNTKHHFEVRICEHLGISHLTGKKAKIENKLMAIQ